MDYRALARKDNPFDGLSEDEAVRMHVYFNLVAESKMNDEEIYRRWGHCIPFNKQLHLGQAMMMALEIESELARGSSESSRPTATVKSGGRGGCLVPIALIISAVLGLGTIIGCGSSEPSNSEIATGMKKSFIRETGGYSSNLDAKARKIGEGRWAVEMTAEKDGYKRTLNATAVMDKNGDIHYYTR